MRKVVIIGLGGKQTILNLSILHEKIQFHKCMMDIFEL